MPFVDPFAKTNAATAKKVTGTKFVDPFAGSDKTTPTPPTKSFLSEAASLVKKYGAKGMEAARFLANPLEATVASPTVGAVTADLAKEVVRGTTRGAAGIALDVANNKKGFTPTTSPEKAVFGSDYVPSFTERANSAVQTGRKLAQDASLPKYAVPLAGAAGAAAAVALTTLDTLPVFPEKTNLQLLSKLTDVEKIKPILSKLGIADHALEDTAKVIAGTKSIPKVEDALRIARTATPAVQDTLPAVSAAKDAVQATQKVVEPVIQRVEPVVGTGETKVRGLAQGVEAKAVEKKLTDGFGTLPEYAQVNMKEQAKHATDLIASDFEKAKRIAMGTEQAPSHILPESVFTAVEDHAIKTGDVTTLRDLATKSNLTSEATTMGQRIRALAERNPDSPISAIQDIVKTRLAAAERRVGNVKKATKQVTEEITTRIKKSAPTPQDWGSFVKSLEC